MSDMFIELDDFGMAIAEILEDVQHGIKDVTPGAVKEGLKVGAKAWRKGAPVMTGKYKRSIRWHMMRESGDEPSGEIGSPTRPGLPHLLEKGHARVGGGRVAARVHIEPAAEEAFDATEKAVLEGVDRVL